MYPSFFPDVHFPVRHPQPNTAEEIWVGIVAHILQIVALLVLHHLRVDQGLRGGMALDELWKDMTYIGHVLCHVHRVALLRTLRDLSQGRLRQGGGLVLHVADVEVPVTAATTTVARVIEAGVQTGAGMVQEDKRTKTPGNPLYPTTIDLSCSPMTLQKHKGIAKRPCYRPILGSYNT